MKNIQNQPLVLFDGVCNLCNTSIQYIIKNDHQQKFKFASLQSDAAKEILLQFQKNNSDLDSIILIYKGKIYSHSSAIIRVAKLLGGINLFAIIFWIVPKPIRDWVYNYIAKNRYKWYGKRESCMIPTEGLKKRFL